MSVAGAAALWCFSAGTVTFLHWRRATPGLRPSVGGTGKITVVDGFGDGTGKITGVDGFGGGAGKITGADGFGGGTGRITGVDGLQRAVRSSPRVLVDFNVVAEDK
ncbi:unnamed protein product, partial [Laminaria digitata]